MYDSKKLRERYEQDVEFYQLVECIEAWIVKNGVNPQEIREAVFFACLKYQNEHFPPIILSDGRTFTFKDAI